MPYCNRCGKEISEVQAADFHNYCAECVQSVTDQKYIKYNAAYDLGKKKRSFILRLARICLIFFIIAIIFVVIGSIIVIFT